MIRDPKEHFNKISTTVSSSQENDPGISSETYPEIYPEILYAVDRNATPSWRIDDYIKCYNLMLIYDGSAEFEYDHVSFRVSRGDLVFCRPGTRRRMHTFSDNLMKAYAIDFQYICPVFRDNAWELLHPELPFSSLQRIEDEYLLLKLFDMFSKLTKSSLSGKSYDPFRNRALLAEVLTLLIQYKGSSQYNYSSLRKVNAVINYMTEHYSGSITLMDLADFARISPSYLGSIFKKVTGKPVIDYLIGIRINKAKALLADGFSITETARLVGFNDIFYFSRVFKKQEGISPSQYKSSLQI
ncbi:AraC-like DNA-binding protein [Anaerotaenia torta]|uniref:AraC family transcriptional regulator n=1 Tax=Anaerotaenia torta TaxID=433293 RepID=UPI003D213059